MKTQGSYYHNGKYQNYKYDDEIITCICGEEFVEDENYSTKCPICGRQYKLMASIVYLPKPSDFESED